MITMRERRVGLHCRLDGAHQLDLELFDALGRRNPPAHTTGWLNDDALDFVRAIFNGLTVIKSRKNIKPGDEFSYDYGEEYCIEHCQPCRCGAKKHLYEKAGVRSRAAATLWAFEQDLVHAA